MITLPWAKRPKSFTDEFAKVDPGFLGGGEWVPTYYFANYFIKNA